jgi:transcription termination/antitermination protein NusG
MPEPPQQPVALPPPPALGEWFALQTKARHEKRVACELEEKQFAVFLPLYAALHQWSDRRREVRLPLFPNYVFVRVGGSHGDRVAVLRTQGVRGFVGARGTGLRVPDEEIEAVQRILAESVPFANHPFLQVGRKVRIRGGSLEGVRGILVAANRDRSLVVSVECIQRSLAIRIDGYGVDPL